MPDNQQTDNQEPAPEEDLHLQKLHEHLDRAFGKLVQLMAKTPGWTRRIAKDIYEKSLPPLASRQYRFVANGEGDIVAYICWAMVSSEVEQRLAANEPIAISEWQSGDIVFVVDVIAPNPRACSVLVAKLKQEVFADRPLKAMRVSKDGAELAEVPSVAAATKH